MLYIHSKWLFFHAILAHWRSSAVAQFDHIPAAPRSRRSPLHSSQYTLLLQSCTLRQLRISPSKPLTFGLTPVCGSLPLAYKEGPKVASPPIHLHGAGIADGDEEAISRLQKGSAGLMQGEETGLLTPRPAGAAGRFHQQDGHRVGTHLWTTSSRQEQNLHKQSMALYIILAISIDLQHWHYFSDTIWDFLFLVHSRTLKSEHPQLF